MAARCLICRHPECLRIEQMADQKGLRSAAAYFLVSKDTLHRHQRQHVAERVSGPETPETLKCDTSTHANSELEGPEVRQADDVRQPDEMRHLGSETPPPPLRVWTPVVVTQEELLTSFQQAWRDMTPRTRQKALTWLHAMVDHGTELYDYAE